MFSSTRRSRRQRNQQGSEKKDQPFFSKAGKGTVQTKEDNSFFQAKEHSDKKGLTVGKPGDKYEKEADAVAATVVNQSSNAPAVQQQKGGGMIQRITLATPQEDEKHSSTTEDRMERDKYIQEKPEVQKMDGEQEGIQEKAMPEEKEQESARMKQEEEQPGLMKMDDKEQPEAMKMEEPEGKEEEDSSASPDAAQAKHESNEQGRRVASKGLSKKIEERKGKGRALPKKIQAEMEKAMGVNFDQVTIHSDASAVEMNKALGAQAFTHGKDIFFNTGKFNPENSAGKQLLAHELTHVVQQNAVSHKSGAASQKTKSSSASPAVQMNGGGKGKSKRAVPEHQHDRDANYILQWIGAGYGGTLGRASEAEILKAAEVWIKGNQTGSVETSPGKWKWTSDDRSEERIFFSAKAKGDGHVQANFIKYLGGNQILNAHVTKAS